MQKTVEDLAAYLQSKYCISNCTEQQIWICLAGGPGCGKSTLAQQLVRLLNKQHRERLCKLEDNNNSLYDDIAVCLPMDGFHYSRAQLSHISKCYEQKNEVEINQIIQSIVPSPPLPITYDMLIFRRGAPWTFNVHALATMFKRAKLNNSGILPVYSREKSDPVCLYSSSKSHSFAELKTHHRIVIVEGNYLLMFGTPGSAAGDDCLTLVSDTDVYNPESLNGITAENFAIPYWKDLAPLWDERWYIECESAEQQVRGRLYLQFILFR